MSHDSGMYFYNGLNDAEIEEKARRLVSNEWPSSDEEHFKHFVAALMSQYYRTGKPLEQCWLEM